MAATLWLAVMLAAAGAATAAAADATCVTQGCHGADQYCDPYESVCKQCNDICLPPANLRFEDCAKNCVEFLRKALTNGMAERADGEMRMATLEALQAVVTAVSLVTLLLVLVLVVKRSQRPPKTASSNVMPMLRLKSHSEQTLSTSVANENRNGGISYAPSPTNRVPSEDRVPPSSHNSFDNFAMTGRRTNLPPLSGPVS